MKSNIEQLQTNTFYHIYNRGINGEDIFKATENYNYFLNKYSTFVSPVADTYAYCLLKNHFHILIKTKSEEDIKAQFNWKDAAAYSIISTQLSHLFNGYAQAINKSFKRTGALLETPFRRKEIVEDNYLRQVLFYIHFNPEKHHICKDFRKYPYSSYLSFLSLKDTKLQRQKVLKWFGGLRDFELFHSDLKNFNNQIVEF